MSRSARLVPAASVLLATTTLAAGAASAQRPMGPPAVGTTVVHRVPIVRTSEYIGRVQAIDSVALVARVTGYLEQRLFTEGSEVRKGQLLYVIEQPPYQAQVQADQGALAQAQANAAFAAAQFKRQQNLLRTPAGQQSNFDQTLATQRADDAAVLSAAANLKTAGINLAYTEIRAPIDGRITATSVNPGNVVGPTSGTLATLVSQDPMYVTFPVAEQDVAALQKRYAASGGLGSARIRIRFTDGRIYGQDGRLDYVAPTVSNSTDTITLRATVPNPPFAAGADHGGGTGTGTGTGTGAGGGGGTGDRALVSGQFVTALIQAPQAISLITVPQSAVLSDQQGSYVFTVGTDDVAHRADIHTGEQTGTDVAVLSGIKDGATVVVDGIQRVRDGAKVKPGAPAPSPLAGASPPSAATGPTKPVPGGPKTTQDNASHIGTSTNGGNGGTR